MKTCRILRATLLMVICFSALLAQPLTWKMLGTKKVNFKTEKDVITVGADEGVFKKVKLMVKNSGIHLKDMKILFLNGDVIDVKVREVIPAGGETRAIDLPGNNRIIEKVVFWYESTKKNKKRATVILFGMK